MENKAENKMERYRRAAVLCRILIDISCLGIIIYELVKFRNDFGYDFDFWRYRVDISFFDRRDMFLYVTVDSLLCLFSYYNNKGIIAQLCYGIVTVLMISSAVPIEGINVLNDAFVLKYVSYAPFVPYVLLLLKMLTDKMKKKRKIK